MTAPFAITQEETADRFALRELVDTFARHADRRAIDDLVALFTRDGRTLVFLDPSAVEPTQVLNGHAEHAEMFSAVLARYAATTHFNGQSTVTIEGNTGAGETYCLAHHVLQTDGTLMIMGIRYQDTFAKQDGEWRFAERHVLVDWTDMRS
jgi:ketosteroid isomerase-like protein